MSDNLRSLWRVVMVAGVVALPAVGGLPVAAQGAQEPAGAPKTVLTDMMDAATARRSGTGSVSRGSAASKDAGGTSWILWGSLVTTLGAAGILLAVMFRGRTKERESAAGTRTVAKARDAATTEAPVPSKEVPRDRPVPDRPPFPVLHHIRPDAAGSYETTASEPAHGGSEEEEEDAPRGRDDADASQATPPAPASNPYATPKPAGPSVDHWIPRCGPEG